MGGAAPRRHASPAGRGTPSARGSPACSFASVLHAASSEPLFKRLLHFKIGAAALTRGRHVA